MTVLIVPDLDEEPWPTLGPQVCWWIEQNLVHGPGDIRGERVKLNPEQRAAIYRMYEVRPRDVPAAGRRRFKRAALSWRKGTAKTEFAAFIAAVELHPEGPVRCVGWDGNGNPLGGAVRDPYIPLVAYTEEQSDELCYGALLAILQECRAGQAFDLGLERIMRKDGAGRAVSLAGAPNARDGARTTFQVFDETHRWTLAGLKRAHRTMLANVPKRFMSDPWSLEITTAFGPGEGSVAEDTMAYARAIERGEVSDPTLFFFHRQAGEEHDLTTREGRVAAVLEASGPHFAAWSDIDAIVGEWDDPEADQAYLERVWCNRPVQAAGRAFDIKAWRANVQEGVEVPAGDAIALGFDGNRWRDGTALIATHLESGYQWSLGIWERPALQPDWEAPAEVIDGLVDDAFATWEVVRMYADPRYWESWVADWQGRYGEKRVVEWRTDRRRPMAAAIKAWHSAIVTAEHSHSGDALLTRHVGNAFRQETQLRDEEGKPLWLVRKERDDSPDYIDGVLAAVLSWEAANDSIAGGALEQLGTQVFV